MSRSTLPAAVAFSMAVALAAVSLQPAAASAAPASSLAESRGFQNCRAAAERDAGLYSVERHYFIYQHDDARRYYMNGYARQNGATTQVRIDCLTTASGHRVKTVSVGEGRFAGRLVERPAVARN